MKKAFITGITGQDGSYMADLLISKDYKIYGLIRRKSVDNFERIEHLTNKIELVKGDLTDQGSLDNIIKSIQPDEVYHFGAMSYVPDSWQQPALTFDTNAMGTLRILEAIRKFSPQSKFYFAGSSEQFGNVKETPQSEDTRFYPRSPYGISKVAGYYITINYRESYNLFAYAGLSFNHESERRGKEFVTRKITSTIAKIKKGLTNKIELGNLQAKRDWGYAPDYCEAFWLMLQQPEPDDFVIATGETHSIEEFVKVAFQYAGILNWRDYIKIDEKFFRPSDVFELCGNTTKIRTRLGWQPKTKFEKLIEIMIKHDLEQLT